MTDVRVKALHRDLDAIGPFVVAALLLVWPRAAHHADQILALAGLAFGGRFAVRVGAVVAAGRGK